MWKWMGSLHGDMHGAAERQDVAVARRVLMSTVIVESLHSRDILHLLDSRFRCTESLQALRSSS